MSRRGTLIDIVWRIQRRLPGALWRRDEVMDELLDKWAELALGATHDVTAVAITRWAEYSGDANEAEWNDAAFAWGPGVP